jgi:hypothetical protein
MSGPDTSRGINFQYACTIGFILDFPLNPEWQMIQMEGDEDIEDVLIFDENDQILVRAQIKQKEDPYQWQPNELRGIFQAFSVCPDSGNTHYQFVYAGAEGKTVVHEVKPILLKLRFEDRNVLDSSETETLSRHFGDQIKDFLINIGNRIELIKRETWESLEARDLLKLRRLLAQHSGSPVEDDHEQVVYNDIFRSIAKKTEKPPKYFRQLTRQQIFELLQIKEPISVSPTLDIAQYLHFLKTMIQKWEPIIPLALQEESVIPNILSFAIRVEDESVQTEQTQFSTDTSLPLLDTVKHHRQIVLVGESGGGKTVSLWHLALSQCESLEKASTEVSEINPIPVIINLAGYEGDSITDLIQQSFHITGELLGRETINNLAKQGRLVLLFDDFDLAKSDQLSSLLLRLKTWCTSHRRCSVVITTHRPADGHNLGLPTFRLKSLQRSQAEQILSKLPGIEHVDILKILDGLSEDSKHLTTSPLLLRMVAYFYLNSDHQVPESRTPLYQEIREGICALSEEKGFVEFERSDKVNLLALIARWMQENETYVLPPAKISSLIGEWIRNSNDFPGLTHLQSCNQLRLRSELLNSGFLRTALDGNVEFIHPTFRAYFATLTISTEELSQLLDKNSWRTSLILWVSLRERQETDALINLISRYPLFLGQLIRERAQKRNKVSLSQTQLEIYFNEFKRFFDEFVAQFPTLLQNPPWQFLTTDGLELILAQSSSNDYMITWRRSKNQASIKWTTGQELLKIADSVDEGYPLPIWILPREIIKKLHPLEIVYLWVIRSLFDIVAFAGWVGGIDIAKFSSQPDSHPAIALVTNRFLLYQEFASMLHPEIRDQLPFYATKEYDLAIEVNERVHPAIVRYAITTGHQPGGISIIQSILKDTTKEPALFEQDDRGNWYFRYRDQKRSVNTITETSIANLWINSPGSDTTKWLENDLERYLPSFPPQPW